MKIQTSISGFQGKPVTILSVYDEEVGTLTVAKSVAFKESRVAPDVALVANVDLAERDGHFTEDHLREAIRAYFSQTAMGYLILDDEISRFRPDNRIEKDKVDETGQKFRIDPAIDNGQVAILATVWYAETQKSIGSMMDAFDGLGGADFDFQTI